MENEDWVSFEIKSERNLIGELGEVIARHVLSEMYEPCRIYGGKDESFPETARTQEPKLIRDLSGWSDFIVEKYTEDRNFREKVVLIELKTHLGTEFDIRGNPRKRLERQIGDMKELTHYKNVEAKVMKICFTIENLKYMLSPV